MIDEPTRDLLQECVRRESRSLLQYVREVPVWVSPADRPTLEKLRSLATAEKAATEDLARFLQKKRIGSTVLGPFPSSFSTVNDAALNYVLPLLVREHRAAIATLTANRAAVADQDSQALLERMETLKRQHFPALEALTTHPHIITGLPATL